LQVEHVIDIQKGKTYATILADLKSMTGSITFPNSSLHLSILRVARMDTIAIHSNDVAIWLPTHFLEWNFDN